MAVQIRIWGLTATIEGYRWRCRDAQTAALLNSMLDPGGPSSADPAPDIHAAERIAEALGGEVLPYEAPHFDADRIY